MQSQNFFDIISTLAKLILDKRCMNNMTETIPKFPNFRPFTMNDIAWYYDYYLEQGLNPYVDIHPENLFVWLNINDDLMISELDGDIVIRYTNVLNNNQTNIIPLSNSLKNSALEKIFSYLKDNNLLLELHEVPSIICKELDQNKWLIEDDRDSYEYILDTNQQSVMEGSNFSDRRRDMKRFERMYPNEVMEAKYYKHVDDNVKNAFLHHINTMPFNIRIESSQQNLVEPIAIRKNIEYSSIFHKKALVIRINKKIVSLSMVSYLDDNTAAINHLKVDYSIKNIFRYTIYQLAKILKEDGINEMNFEQDLGIEGLRTFKKQLRPSRFLEKKIIRPRPQ